MSRRYRGVSCLLTVATWALMATHRATADSAVINFTANLSPSGFTGPDQFSPFVPGNALSFFAAGEPDVIKADGQFYIQDFIGDGIYNASTAGNRFLLHSPLIERIEADTWRAEGPSNHGTLSGAGAPIVQRRKFLLPTESLFGTATVTVSGGQITELNYALDFSQPGVPGFENTSLPSTLLFNEIGLGLGGATFSSTNVGAVGSAAADAVPYGFNTALSLTSYPPSLLSGTVIDTTRGMLNDEIFNNTDEIGGTTPNISADGRLDGGIFPSSITPTGDVYLADPFAGETGDLFVFDANSELALSLSVSAVPEPSAILALIPIATWVAGRRRRRTFATSC
ncbi:MAG: hypothetical protein AAGC97_08920 [Planctomycetota bacterium]